MVSMGFSNQTSIYFEIHDTRAGSVSTHFLLESQVRFLVTDAYSGYNRTIREINDGRKLKKLPLLHSILCNDHGRRYFFYAQEAPLAKKALDLYDQICHIERQVQKLLSEPVYQEPQNSQEALKLRQTADPLFSQIYETCCEILLEASEKSLEATAAKYFMNHVEGLTLYLRQIELPISNAPSERGIRDWVLLRKTALGNHSQAGAEEAAIQLTVTWSSLETGMCPSSLCLLLVNTKNTGIYPIHHHDPHSHPQFLLRIRIPSTAQARNSIWDFIEYVGSMTAGCHPILTHSNIRMPPFL